MSAAGRGWLAVAAPAAILAASCSGLLDYDAISFGPASADDAGVGGAGEGGAAGKGGSTNAGGSSAGGSSAGGSSAGGSNAGGSSAGGSSAGGSSAGGSANGGAPPGPCDAVQCGENQHCEPATKSCVCNPGFVSNGSGCSAAPPGDPTTHTQAEVCDRWNKDHQVTDGSPWSAGPTECDPGTLTQAGITDTLTRLALYRWMCGLGPVSDSASLNEMNMYCAAVAAWNPPGVVPNPHSPPASAKCYTAEGAQGAGQSNIAWGSGHPAEAIDQFVQDWGNDTTFGHRRWILNPPLGPVGIGFYAGGGQYGNAECLAVFGSSGGGPTPEWVAFPPPGFVPISVVDWTWTLQAPGAAQASLKVTRSSDSAVLDFDKLPLQQGYGMYEAIAFRPKGWNPAAGEKYIVEYTGVSAGTISFELTPVSCN